MNASSQKLLAQFSPGIANHIVEFCKQLNQAKCDVFIVFARKAACFISVLEDSGMLQLPAMLVSERVMDYDTEWLKGKSIVLIDDTVISGTSIFKTIRSLEDIGVKNIAVQVFCVNDFWFVKEMLENENGQSYLKEPFLRLEHAASLTFCKDIVKSFSIYPRPYSTDFPIYESINLTEADTNQLESLKQWKIVNTTSQLQEMHNVRCFSLNPKKEVLDDFFKQVGIPIEKHSYLKLRVYAEQFKSSKDNKIKYKCRILPLVIFEPTTHEFLDRMVASICESEMVERQFVFRYLITPIAKLRFIQFYFAHRLFVYSIGSFSQALGRTLKYKVNQKEIDLLFPPELVLIIQRFEFRRRMLLHDDDIDHKFLPFQPTAKKSSIAVNPYEITELLIAQFLKLYYEKEMVARRTVKSLKKDAFKNRDNQNIINRLNEGYTFGDLKRIINEKVPFDGDQNLILSNFLDSTIDSGIVVPVTLDKDGFTSRGYRHGEEIIWGENNDKLLAIFYKSFLEKAGLTQIKKFWLEKSLVLFIKMGLKERILDEYNSQMAPPQAMHIVAVRSYLFGQVTIQYELRPGHDTTFNPILDYEVKGHWTTQRLQDIGVLLPAEDSYNLDLDRLTEFHQKVKPFPNEPSDLSADLVAKAEEMGELVGLARSQKLLNNEGLVLLTSCLTIHDCLPSIAAELYIYHENIDQVINWVKHNNHKKSHTVKSLYQLRDYEKNHGWTAVNSGCDKFIDFKLRKADELVHSISQGLVKSGGSFQKRAWNKYWQKDSEESPSKSPDLFALNDEIGFALLEVNVLMTYLQVLIYEMLIRDGSVGAYISGRETEVGSRNTQLERVRKKIGKLQPVESASKQVEISFENAGKIAALQKEERQLSSIIENDTRDVNYLKNYAETNILRVRKFEEYYQKLSISDFPFKEHRINFITQFYKTYTDDVILQTITDIIGILHDYRVTAKDLLVNFSSLVPQWGKFKPVAVYACLIHLTTDEPDEGNRKLFKNAVVKLVEQFNIDNAGDNDDSINPAVILHPNKFVDKPGLIIGGRGSFTIDKMTRLAGILLEQCNLLGVKYHLYFFPSLEENDRVRAFHNRHRNEADDVNDDFLPRLESMESQFLPFTNSILLFNTLKGKSAQDYKNLINKAIKGSVKYDLMSYKSNSGKSDDLIHLSFDSQAVTPSVTIGVVTALPIEFSAMKIVLDGIDETFKKPVNDSNDYVKGWILNKNNIKVHVIVALAKEMGESSAGVAAVNILRSFPEIDDIIMTGIAGAVPNPAKHEDHIRLGDIVVSDGKGVLQYDNIKDTGDKIEIRSSTAKPSATLLGLARTLESEIYLHKTPWNNHIEKGVKQYPAFERPPAEFDKLSINHVIVDHPYDPDRVEGVPKVSSGPIGSANTLLKNEKKRDQLRDEHKVKAIEMEGYGIANGTWELGKGYLVVRGTVDYCNHDKSDKWHKYSALIAAAYTKSIIHLL